MGAVGFTQGTGATIDTVSVSNWFLLHLCLELLMMYIFSRNVRLKEQLPWFGPNTITTHVRLYPNLT